MECVLGWRVESFIEAFINMSKELISNLSEFLDNEARSCSMDCGCVTPIYVYRMWGGTVALEDIEAGLKEIKNDCR